MCFHLLPFTSIDTPTSVPSCVDYSDSPPQVSSEQFNSSWRRNVLWINYLEYWKHWIRNMLCSVLRLSSRTPLWCQMRVTTATCYQKNGNTSLSCLFPMEHTTTRRVCLSCTMSGGKLFFTTNLQRSQSHIGRDM